MASFEAGKTDWTYWEGRKSMEERKELLQVRIRRELEYQSEEGSDNKMQIDAVKDKDYR